MVPTPLILGTTDKPVSDQFCSMCYTSRLAVFLLSDYEAPLAVILGCLVNIYYIDTKQENTFPSFPTNTRTDEVTSLWPHRMLESKKQNLDLSCLRQALIASKHVKS